MEGDVEMKTQSDSESGCGGSPVNVLHFLSLSGDTSLRQSCTLSPPHFCCPNFSEFEQEFRFHELPPSSEELVLCADALTEGECDCIIEKLRSSGWKRVLSVRTPSALPDARLWKGPRLWHANPLLETFLSEVNGEGRCSTRRWALDLGAGCGRDATRLLEAGFSVIAVEMRRPLALQIAALAARHIPSLPPAAFVDQPPIQTPDKYEPGHQNQNLISALISHMVCAEDLDDDCGEDDIPQPRLIVVRAKLDEGFCKQLGRSGMKIELVNVSRFWDSAVVAAACLLSRQFLCHHFLPGSVRPTKEEALTSERELEAIARAAGHVVLKNDRLIFNDKVGPRILSLFYSSRPSIP